MKNVKKITILYFFIIFFTSRSFGLPLNIISNHNSIRLGELVSLEVDTADATDIKWKIENKIYSTERVFNFSPTEVGIYTIKVFRNEVEEDSIMITVNAFPTPECSNTTISARGVDGKTKEFTCNIQKALDFVHLHNGGIVHLSSGTYPINQQLIFYNNTTLEGSVEGDTLRSMIRLEDNVKWSDRGKGGKWVSVPPLIINDANIDKSQSLLHEALSASNHDITVKNLIINGNRENQLRKWHPGKGHYVLLDFKDITDLTISNVTLFGGLSDGIFIKTGRNISISNSNISDMGHSAIFQVEVYNSTVENNRIDVNLNSGIRFFGGSDFTIRDNTIFSSTNYGNYGVQISEAYSNGVPMKNVLVENNIIFQTPYAGIALYASTKDDIAEATIKNNIIVGCGSKAPNLDNFPNTTIEESGGINIQSFKNVVIKNNTLLNNYGSGIWVDNRFYDTDVNFEEIDSIEKYVTITNNIILGSHSSKKSVYAIEKYPSENSSGTTLSISNNIFYNNQNSSYSSNITSNKSNFFNENPDFIDISNRDLRFKANSIALSDGTIVIGTSEEMIERYRNISLEK
jgi:parallel beta-helix repeat protein